MNGLFMRLALAEAAKGAEDYGEVPVGAVVVKDGVIIGRAHNFKETLKDPTAHAEILAIKAAAEQVGGWRLDGCDIYVTLEPCPMCAGAIIQARISRIFFGAYDGKAGCCGSLYSLPEDKRFNHRPEVVGGIMEEDCAEMLSRFFLNKRKNVGS
ncbi:MAG: nucleoside deaminase [Christensenellales bacterium]|jgi:tRNA(adenine34) deaminase